MTYTIATANGTATAGTDYVASTLSGQSIAAGVTSKTFAVTLNGDATVEANETFTVNLSAAVGATIFDSQAIGTILNDDGPTLSIADVAIAEGNSGTKVATFTVKLSVAAAVPVTYTIATANGTATAGTDYVASSLSGQSIAAGVTSRTFSVTLSGDTTVEANETFLVNLSAPVGATIFDSQAIGTILNDDGPTLSIADVAIAEGNSGTKVATFTVKLSVAAAVPVTYTIATANGTATAGTDYVASTLSGQSIAAGVTSKTFAVTLNGDATVEANETFTVNLSAAVGATIFDSQAIGTINNDDVAPAINPQPASNDGTGAITIGSLSMDGINDDQDDGHGEHVSSQALYATRLAEAADALCQAGSPMVVGVAQVGNRGMLADLAGAVEISCAQHYRAFTADDAAGTMGFLASTAEVRPGVAQVELVSLAELGKSERFRQSGGLLEALHPQPPEALAVRVNSPDGSMAPLTVLMAMIASEDPAKHSAQAQSLAKLVQGLRHDDPGLRLVMLREGGAADIGMSDLIDLTDRYNSRLEGQVEAVDHILVSRNLLTDYPKLHVETTRSHSVDRSPQVLVLPRQ